MRWPGLVRADMAAIAIGGTAGAVLRWAVTRQPTEGGWFEYAPNTATTLAVTPGLPGGTLAVNLVGCLLLGALTLLLTRARTSLSRRIIVGAATGFCGSLTTFSTFAVETANLFRGQPPHRPPRSTTYLIVTESSPAWTFGVAYVVVSVIGGAGAFWLGRAAVRRLGGNP